MTKIRVRKQIDKLLDPNDGRVRIRYYVNPRPLDPDSPNVLYKTVLSRSFPRDVDICCVSRECADTSIKLAGEEAVLNIFVKTKEWHE